VDCGPVVNPAIVSAQMMGGLIMGQSAAMKEKIEFANGGVKSENFSDYELLPMSEAPDVDVHIVKSDAKLGGIGEPGTPPAAPAIANAVFAATGARIRQLPMKPETVLAAMKKA
jgi:isoquinoline 1-oxidoreductase beta subunit